MTNHSRFYLLCLSVLSIFLWTVTQSLAAPFAYITNGGSTTISIVDTSTNTVVDTIPVGTAPSGVGVNPAGTRVYVANSDSGTVSVIETSTNTVVDTIPVGSAPYGVGVNPAGTRVYVAHSDSGTVSVIDTSTITVVDTIPVGSAPYGVGVNPAGTRVYVANSDSGTVSVIDTSTNTVVDTIPVGIDPVAFGLFIGPLGVVTAQGAPTGVTATVPGAPTIGTATAGNAQATVSFTPPASDGGSAITSYTVTSSPGGITAQGSGSPITVTGLINGTAYTFTVKATNALGSGPASSPSNSVTPVGPPGAPTSVTATAGNAHAMVSFTAPASNGGSAITSYTVTSSPGGITAQGTGSPITVTALTNWTAYTFTVMATNAVGTGAASSPSNSITPVAPTVPGGATLVSPSGSINTNTPTYTWNAVSNSTWYYLWVSDSTGDKIQQWYKAADAGCASGTGTCSVTPQTPLAAGSAKWWIQTWNPNGYGPWSSAMAFTPVLPGKATLISPSGAIATTTPTYTWNADAQATWYYLWVSDSTGIKIQQWFTAVQAGCPRGTGICTVTSGTALAAGSAQWWIQTWNPNGYGPWSDGMAFSIGP